MSDRTDLWMPLFVADYLRDTQHLSTTEHGAYLLLLMHAWTNGGALPLDERRFARIAKLDRDEWADSGPILLAFFRVEDGCRRHKRVDVELARASANLEQKRAAGRKSAERRAAQRKGNDRSTDAATRAATYVPAGSSTEGQRGPQREGNPPPPPPPPPTTSPCPPDLAAVIEAAGMTSLPTDRQLLREWLALPDMQLERDVLPVIRRVSEQVRERGGRTPFKLKLFDTAVREKHAADEAEIARLRAITARAARDDAAAQEAR